MKRSCTSSYYLQQGNLNKHSLAKTYLHLMFFVYSGEIVPISGCEVTEEFNGVNHKTSHDGLYKVVARDIREDILDEIGGIRITFDGSCATH